MVKVSPTPSPVRKATFLSIMAVLSRFPLSPCPAKAGGSPGKPGSTPIKEISNGSRPSAKTIEALLKPMDPTALTPSTRLISLSLDRSKRLEAIDRSTFSWYKISSAFSFSRYSRLPAPSPSAKPAMNKTRVVIKAMTRLIKKNRPRLRQTSLKAR